MLREASSRNSEVRTKKLRRSIAIVDYTDGCEHKELFWEKKSKMRLNI